MGSIYWIRHAEPSRLAIVDRPSGGEHLEEDLINLKHGGIDVLVSLLETREEAALGLEDESRSAKALGMQFISHPIPDGLPPGNLESFRKFILNLIRLIDAGKNIGVHCRGSIGRSTTTATTVLIELGWGADDALELIDAARGWRVSEAIEQKDWVRGYKPGDQRVD